MDLSFKYFSIVKSLYSFYVDMFINCAVRVMTNNYQFSLFHTYILHFLKRMFTEILIAILRTGFHQTFSMSINFRNFISACFRKKKKSSLQTTAKSVSKFASPWISFCRRLCKKNSYIQRWSCDYNQQYLTQSFFLPTTKFLKLSTFTTIKQHQLYFPGNNILENVICK